MRPDSEDRRPPCLRAFPSASRTGRARGRAARRSLGLAARLGLALLVAGCGASPGPPPFPDLSRFADDSGVQELVAVRIAGCASRPRDAERWRSLGVALEANERLEEAIPFYAHALELDPKSARSEYRLAATLEAASRLDEAARHFARAASLQPEDSLPWRRRGGVLLAVGDLRGAREAFDRAQALGDGLPAIVGLAEVELASGQMKEALARLLPHEGQAAQWPPLAAALAAALRANGERDRAASLAPTEGALGGWPDRWDEELLASKASLAGGLELAARELALGRAGAAVVRMEALRSRYGERGPILALLGGAYLAANRLDDAERTLSEARRIGPEQYALALNSAAVEHLRGRPGSALPFALRALELQPDSAKAAELAGTILAGTGRLEEAAGHFARARRLAPGKLELLLRAAEIEARLARWSEAAGTYRAARTLAPTRADLPLAEAQCAARAGERAAAERALADAERLGARQEDVARVAELLRRLES